MAIFQKPQKAKSVASLEKDVRQKEIERLNQEIGEINTIQEANNKVITKINNIFKDED